MLHAHPPKCVRPAAYAVAVMAALAALGTGAVTAAPAPPLAWQWAALVQGRASFTQGDTGSPGVLDSFDIKRANVTANVTATPRFAGSITINGEPSPFVQEAYGEYRGNGWKGRLGLVRIPFGLEVPMSSAKLITLERSAVVQNGMMPTICYDRGVFFYRTQGRTTMAAAVVNGARETVATDPNRRKNVVGRLARQFRGGSIGVSAYNGTDPTDQGMDRLGGDLTARHGPLTLMSEVIQGKNGATPLSGGYIALAYQGKGSNTQPYLRHDTYDPNRDAAGNTFHRWTLGVNQYVAPSARLTIEVESIDDDANPGLDGRLSTQMQLQF